ncbi:MAG: histidine phosphatase family protein [Gemmataceae bacterium]|nr:histidine phosphatase family protein [Gemmataceae bacterium]
MRLILVRHGQSEGNASGVLQGRLDFGLTPLGVRQSLAVARRLAPVDGPARLLSSPLKRAADTAAVIATRIGLQVQFDTALAEYDVGAVSGLTAAEIRARFPDILDAYRRGDRPSFPGEEGRDHFARRVSSVLDQWQDSGGTVIAVAHGGVIAALCSLVLGLDLHRPGLLEVANCSLTEIVRDPRGRPVLARSNDTCHLQHVDSPETD